jgi:hypothetical protein
MNNEIDGKYPCAPPALFIETTELVCRPSGTEFESTPAPPSPDKKPNPKAKASPKKTAHKKNSVKDSIVGGSSTSGQVPMKPSHPTITLELLEIALNSVTAEHRSQVATAHGVVPNLLHMVRMEA